MAGTLLIVTIFAAVQALALARLEHGPFHTVFAFAWLLDFSVWAFYKVLIYPFYFSPFIGLPEPTGGKFILAHGAGFFTRPAGVKMLKWVRTVPNEGIIRVRGFFNLDRLLLTSPKSLQEVLSQKSYDFEKPPPVRKFLGKILGDGLILVEGNEHKFQRKNLTPAFHIRHIRELYSVFWDKSKLLVKCVAKEIEEKGAGSPKTAVVEMAEWSSRATMDIIGVAAMGRSTGGLENPDDELIKLFGELLEPTREKALFFAANVLLPTWLVEKLPLRLNKVLGNIMGGLHKISRDLIHEKKRNIANNEDSLDILTLLIKENAFSEETIINQLLTFLGAGHETTASALAWAVYLLSVDQDAQERLREEVREKLPAPDEDGTVDSAQIEALPFLNAVVNETLRLYPGVPVTMREAMRDTSIMGQVVPKGTIVMIVPWAINRSPDLWGPDAAKFIPDRWMGEGRANSGGASSNYCQLTFLHGPRSCIGQAFAKAEFKCLLAALVGKIRMELADPNEHIYPAGVITTKPANGMHLRCSVVEGW